MNGQCPQRGGHDDRASILTRQYRAAYPRVRKPVERREHVGAAASRGLPLAAKCLVQQDHRCVDVQQRRIGRCGSERGALLTHRDATALIRRGIRSPRPRR